jgi:hypothetical protein
MGIGTAIGVGASLIGGRKASKEASRAADAQMAAGREAAELAKFKPYSITSGFGSSTFDTDKNTATYDLDPRLAAYRDQLYGLNEQGMAGINLDTQQNAQDYYNSQQGLLAGGRGAEDIALRQQQLNSGRIGLGVSGAAMGAGAGTGYVNPEQYQRDLARGQVDASMAANADQIARQQLDQDIARSTGLFNTGAGVEQLGQSTLTMGADIGNKQAAAGANAGRSLLDGGMAAAQSNLAGGLNKANMYQTAGNAFGGMFSGAGGGSSLGGPSGQRNQFVSAQGGNQKRGFLYGGF